MCTLGEGIYYNARNEALREGMMRDIRNLMESMGWTSQEAMKNLKVPEEERETYEALLNTKTYDKYRTD